MAKEKSEKKAKKEKKEKREKEKRSEKDGVSKNRKEKKSKKATGNGVTAALMETLVTQSQTPELPKTNGRIAPLVGPMVPFANPLADEKVCKKLFKTVKKGKLYI
jgi:H/ACA ribonucleoprotein complex subunit 2